MGAWGRLGFAARQHLLTLLRLCLPAIGVLRGAPGKVRLSVHVPLWSRKAALAALVALLLFERGLGIPSTVGTLGRRGLGAGSEGRNERQGDDRSAHRHPPCMASCKADPGPTWRGTGLPRACGWVTHGASSRGSPGVQGTRGWRGSIV